MLNSYFVEGQILHKFNTFSDENVKKRNFRDDWNPHLITLLLYFGKKKVSAMKSWWTTVEETEYL